MAEPLFNFKTNINWDRAGIGISFLCIIHCILFPVLIALLPLWSFSLTLHTWVHPILLMLIAPTVVFAVWRQKSNRKVKTYLFTGLFLLMLAWFWHDWLGDRGELTITLAASMALITGHWKNFMLHRTCLQKKQTLKR